MRGITLKLPPYVGLRPYTEQEGLLFFGREAHVRDLLVKLESRQRFISVLGASGNGKSSLVRAGLVPALHRGALASAGHDWKVCIVKPGDAPLANLANALADDERWLDGENRELAVSALRAGLGVSPLALAALRREKAERFGSEALLLVVDQFEEIFRYRQQNPDEAERFIQLLLRSAEEDVPIFVVMTMRSDYLGHCVAFLGLPEAINGGLYLTPRLGPDQLKSVIASPLGLAGGDIDPVLVNRLVNGLKGEDELPVLQHALLWMWNRALSRDRRRIEAEDFEAVCRPRPGSADEANLAYAIDRHAQELYDSFGEDGQRAARRLFPALVDRQDGRAVRREQKLVELIEQAGAGHRDKVIEVIDAFRGPSAGFLLPSLDQPLEDGRVVDISHEALIRQWQLLQHWLAEDEADALEFREWGQRAVRQREGGGWLDGNDGERAERWRSRVEQRGDPEVWTRRYAEPGSYQSVSAYIDASRKRVADESAEQERLKQQLREVELQRLQAEARRAKWIAIGAVALLVGGAAVNRFLSWKDEHEFSVRAAGYAALAKARLYTLQPEMVTVPPDPDWNDPAKRTFMMGDADVAQRPVTFAKRFAIGRYEVTFDEYQVFAYSIEDDGGCANKHKIATPSDQDSGWGRGRRLVIKVSWDDAVCYAEWLSKRTGKTYRLPSAAEWEYAARAGTTTRYWWGEQMEPKKAVCWTCDADFEGKAQGKRTAEVDDPAFEANRWGLYHTAGNVYEWVQDCDSDEGAPADGAESQSKDCAQRVIRGGSWGGGPRILRSA